jgi:hypothetical protein
MRTLLDIENLKNPRKSQLFLRVWRASLDVLGRLRKEGSGAAKRIRTPDPRITNALLYRLSYCGISETGGILTRDITRRKAGVELCDIAQRLR